MSALASVGFGVAIGDGFSAVVSVLVLTFGVGVSVGVRRHGRKAGTKNLKTEGIERICRDLSLPFLRSNGIFMR